tara:strand:- start:613 stop:3147 length:2535 start_codon:yes stop_codon:yes gene_type:complete
VSYFWNFGDINSGPLNSSTSQSPSHLYTDCGIFSTTLNIIDNLGCIGFSQLNTEVICNPTAEFTVYDTICDGEVTNFANLSSHVSSNPNIFINQHNWNISPGTYINSTSTSANPSFLFDSCSTSFEAELIVELNQYGCSDTVLHEVTVHCNPNALFTSSVACENTPITFTDESILGDTLIEFWNWNEITNPFSTLQNPTTTLSNTGFVPVTLTITDFFGCTDFIQQNVTVYNNPLVNFEIIQDIICGNDTEVTFSDLSNQANAPSNAIEFWNWNFGDGNLTNLNSPIDVSHEYLVDPFLGELFSAELTVIDTLGCSASTSSDILIHPIPTIDFTVSNICFDDTLIFITDNSIVYTHPSLLPDNLSMIEPFGTLIENFNTSYIINLQNIDTIANQNVVEPNPINQSNYTLEVYTNQGCTTSVNETSFILDNPDIEITSVNYSVNPPCGNNIYISLTSDVSDIQPSPEYLNNYWWDFSFDNGDSPDNQEQNPNNILIPLPTNDTTITLSGFSEYIISGEEFLCTTSVVEVVKTYPGINASLTANPTEECELFEFNLEGNYFQNGSTNVLDPLDSWQYIITNINNDTIYSYGLPDGTPIQAFVNDTAGLPTINGINTVYNAQFVVTTENGCSDDENIELTVYPTPIPDFEWDTVFTNEGIYYGAYEFFGSAESSSGISLNDPPYFFRWYVNDVFVGDGEYLLYRFPATNNYEGTIYNVCLEVESPYGIYCVDSICEDIRVGYAKGLYVPNALTPDANYGVIKEFLPAGKSLESYKLQIFDTWGNLIWETNSLDENGSPNVGWRGINKNGTPVPQGVYVWKIEAKFTDGSRWTGIDGNRRVGSVTLIR